MPYAAWLLALQRWGFGVLEHPGAAKFRFEKPVTGRQVLTYHLQSDIDASPNHATNDGYYLTDEWTSAGFNVHLNHVSTPCKSLADGNPSPEAAYSLGDTKE